jgi:TrpR-related protein YerC/YecD
MLTQLDTTSEQRALYEAVLSLKTPEDCAAFFTDLCTPAELTALAGRWKVARMLNQGLAYREIAEKTGISTATVTRVARCLTYGQEGGYRRVLDRRTGGSRGR